MSIVITFDEPVDPSTLNLSLISISDNDTNNVELNGTKTNDISTTVTIILFDSVLNVIRNTQGLAVEFESTFLNISANAVKRHFRHFNTAHCLPGHRA